MNWKRQRLILSSLRLSLWVVPVAAILIERVFAKVIELLDDWLGWTGGNFGPEGAKAICDTVVTLSLSFIVFTFGSLLVTIQVASGQYTPRIIATTFLRDNVIRYTAGLFVFTLLFAVFALNHIEARVPQLVTFITGVLGLVCIVAFLFLIDYAARLLRPVTLAKLVGDEGQAVINSVYPLLLNEAHHVSLPPPQDAGLMTRTITHRGTSATVLAVDIARLMAEAERTNGVIEFAPQVGDFVGTDEPLFLLHGGASAVKDSTLRSCVHLGSERTMEQDPLFAFRILVDIAIKSLSPAIIDPTTAVLAIDQLHRLLRNVGRRHLRTDYIPGSDEKLRVILRTPDWDDFVHLAFVEIRLYGASNIQIARRLRAMIINLAHTLPGERHAALRQELDLLDRMLEKLYELPEDLALARIPDPQGLGGSTATTAPKWMQ